jgi:hypothetical protein
MLVFASGRAEGNVYFGCSGGLAARTTEKDGHFHAAAGGNACYGAINDADCVRRVNYRSYAVTMFAQAATAFSPAAALCIKLRYFAAACYNSDGITIMNKTSAVKELTIFFIRCSGFAATTNARNVFFRPAGACFEHRRRGDSASSQGKRVRPAINTTQTVSVSTQATMAFVPAAARKKPLARPVPTRTAEVVC